MTATPTVGFDGLFFEQPNSGSGQYATNLWAEYSRGGPWEIAIQHLSPPPARRSGGKPRKVLWEQAGLPRSARKGRIDLVHVPYFSAPLRQSVPYIATVHDVIPLVLPAYASTRQMRMYLRLVARSVRACARIITDSSYSRDDIVRNLGVPMSRISVVPLGVAPEFTPRSTSEDEASIAALRGRYGLDRLFVLNVGGFDVRKRLRQLIQGFAGALPQLPGDYDLVIAGAPHSDNPKVFPPLEPLIQSLGLAQRVRLIGRVSEQDKRDLYRAADAFVFTSEYEGFGLNPLEAMACGCPVISSDRTSLPEVVGDAGILIAPEPEAISNALQTLLSAPDRVADLRQRGRRRADQFTWRRTAEATVAVYLDVLRSHGTRH